jgi:hypothetical protein
VGTAVRAMLALVLFDTCLNTALAIQFCKYE